MSIPIITNGKFNFGVYSDFPVDFSLTEAKYIKDIPEVGFIKKLRQKEWFAFEYGNERFWGITAFYNLQFFGIIHFVLWDKYVKKQYSFEKKVTCWKMIETGSYKRNKTYEYKDKKLNHSSVLDIKRKKMIFNAHLPVYGGIDCYFEADFSGFQPLTVCLPLAQNRAIFSLKIPSSFFGNMEIGGEKFVFSHDDSFLIIDEHKAYYPYHMRYDWVTGAGYNESGEQIVFNLTKNQAQNPGKYNENIVWIDGESYKLPTVNFERGKDIKDEWHILSENNEVNLYFHPETNFAVHENYILAGSEYDSPIGFFSGELNIKNRKINLTEKIYGMGEKKHVWI